MSQEVTATFENGVAVIVMNRPEARNTVNVAASHGVADAIDEMDRRPDIVGITERPPAKPLIAAVEGWALAAGQAASSP